MERRLLIGLSAGGADEELAAQGVGIEDVEDLMVRLASKLLRDGHRLAFGGTLGNREQPLTKMLIETAQSWLDDDAVERPDVGHPEAWPLVNYSAWPFYRMINEGQRSQLVGICQFVNVDPGGASEAELTELFKGWRDDPRGRRCVADALSAMREQSALETDLRIVWGGKIAGAAGWLAGILEEVAFSLERNKPVVVLGGFGGCATLLAEFLASEDTSWPDRLTLDACADRERDELLTELERKMLDKRFESVKSCLTEYRSKMHTESSVNGIPSQYLRDALRAQTARNAIQLGTTVAKLCLEGQ